MKFKARELTGKIEAVLWTPDRDHFVTQNEKSLFFGLEGIEHDRHFGYNRKSTGREKKYYPKGSLTRNNRQWSAISIEETNAVAKDMGIDTIKPEWLGANLLVSGIDRLSKIPPLSHWIIGPEETTLVVFEQNFPCVYPDKVIKSHRENVVQSFPKTAKERRGVLGWVDKPGNISAGDKLRILIPEYIKEDYEVGVS